MSEEGGQGNGIERLNWELTRSEVTLHHLNETLEQRVAERTSELQAKSAG